MKTFTKKQLSVAVACALALSFASGAARAQNMAPADERELWMENSRSMIWKNAYGECWHSFYGPPPPPHECAPAPVAQYGPPPAPVIVTPPPPVVQPAPVIQPAPPPPRKTRG